ncbi:MAG: hypothetical protein H6736_24145 [Alphaproteobacteria bacterium]|nr:hypothetical protein [Alphaproteobacteria bacterium]
MPWTQAPVRYLAERRLQSEDEWHIAQAAIGVDSAVLDDLRAGDDVRVIAVDSASGERVAASPSFRFTPATVAPTTLYGRRILDGRERDWVFGDSTVRGDGAPPAEGDLLVQPLRRPSDRGEPLEVVGLEVSSAGWSAEVRPFTAPDATPPRTPGQPTDSSHGAIALALSTDGMPRLPETRPGYVGYCSASGWGCVEVGRAALDVDPAAVVPSASERARTVTDWYPIDAPSMSWSHAVQGLDLDATATGGIQLQMEYDYSYLPPRILSVAARGRPHATGQVSATLNEATTGPAFEQPIFTVSVSVYSAAVISINAEFGLSGVIEVDAASPATGGWQGAVEVGQTYEVGYRDGFYGPETLDPTAYAQLTPAFGDGSEAEIWVGWKAHGAITATVLGFEGARAELAPRVGVVLQHASTDGAPCNEDVSIARAGIGLGLQLDATASLPPLGYVRTFRLVNAREPIVEYGRERWLVAPPRLADAATGIPYRVRAGALPAVAGGDIDLDDPAGLTAFLDGVTLAGPTTFGVGTYTVSPGSSLVAGSSPVFAVWAADTDYPGTDLLGAPGVCLSTTLTVETH